MEFEMLKDENAQCNKMFLFFLKSNEENNYTHFAWFLLSIWPISSFLGVFGAFVAPGMMG